MTDSNPKAVHELILNYFKALDTSPSQEVLSLITDTVFSGRLELYKKGVRIGQESGDDVDCIETLIKPVLYKCIIWLFAVGVVPVTFTIDEEIDRLVPMVPDPTNVSIALIPYKMEYRAEFTASVSDVRPFKVFYHPLYRPRDRIRAPAVNIELLRKDYESYVRREKGYLNDLKLPILLTEYVEEDVGMLEVSGTVRTAGEKNVRMQNVKNRKTKSIKEKTTEQNAAVKQFKSRDGKLLPEHFMGPDTKVTGQVNMSPSLSMKDAHSQYHNDVYKALGVPPTLLEPMTGNRNSEIQIETYHRRIQVLRSILGNIATYLYNELNLREAMIISLLDSYREEEFAKIAIKHMQDRDLDFTRPDVREEFDRRVLEEVRLSERIVKEEYQKNVIEEDDSQGCDYEYEVRVAPPYTNNAEDIARAHAEGVITTKEFVQLRRTQLHMPDLEEKELVFLIQELETAKKLQKPGETQEEKKEEEQKPDSSSEEEEEDEPSSEEEDERPIKKKQKTR